MTILALALTPTLRDEVLRQTHWLVSEAACYFLDIQPVNFDLLEADDPNPLSKNDYIRFAKDVCAQICEDLNANNDLKQRYKIECFTRYSALSVDDFMAWANEYWRVVYNDPLPALVGLYNSRKSNASDAATNESITVLSTSDISKFLDEEKVKFLHDRGVRLDLWVSLCYDCYKLWWGDALKPIKKEPTTTVEERKKREDKEKENKITYDGWFKKGEKYHSMNKGHVDDVMRGFLNPGNPGGRSPGSKNLKSNKKRSS